MKVSSKWVVVMTLAGIFLFPNSPLPAAELIAPTRTLDGRKEPMGTLTVFSEPPALNVILDEQDIGKTPVISKQVEAGTHVLRIKESETKIVVQPGMPLQFSWFKGAFIETPPQDKEAQLQPKSEAVKTAVPQKTTPPTEKKEENLPLYWPLNPRGPIYPDH